MAPKKTRTYGEILAEAREKAGLTQWQAATKAGYREDDIQRWETNKTKDLKVSVVLRLYQVYYPHLDLQEFQRPIGVNRPSFQTWRDLQELQASPRNESRHPIGKAA